MSPDPEAVMLALLAHIQAKVPSFETTGRRVLHWSQVANQPALFLRRIGMSDTYTGSMLKTTMECELWIYSKAGEDPDVAPDAGLTVLEAEVRDSFAPNDQNRFTIGGLVYWCRIEGRTDVSPGDQGPQAIARIPVRITLP